MACCCRGGKSRKASVSCLGRCDLPKHKCLDHEDVKPGPIPKHMGWHYTAKDSPEHQLRCGWRPGHISCAVLRKIERHNSIKACEPAPCTAKTKYCAPPIWMCNAPCPAPPCNVPQGEKPLLRIMRHGGQYMISTKPSNMDNSPSGPYPLKYVIDNDDGDETKGTKYSVEAKYNDTQFDYTTSQSSFVIDFTPPECPKQCPR